jgi:threonine dehydratase
LKSSAYILRESAKIANRKVVKACKSAGKIINWGGKINQGSEWMSMDFKRGIVQASDRIKQEIKRTPLEYSPALSQISGADVYLKWENEQRTGSFKFRGALNRVRSLSPEEKSNGIVSASTGNHGLGVSLAARMEGVELTLVLPANVSGDKRRRLEEYGAEIIEYGDTCEKAELAARHLAMKTGKVYISPYNDEGVICGQGTIGLEIFEDLSSVDAVLVPIGGGGLIAGIAGYLKSVSKKIRVFGIEPVNSAFMAASLMAGKIVEIQEKETIADAVAGGIEPGSMTFPFCQELLDGIITVEESLIKEAMRLLYEKHQKMVEGAGALALAGLLKENALFLKSKVVLLVSGGNISLRAFEEAVSAL